MILDQSNQRRHDVRSTTLDQQSLRVLADDQCRIAQGRNQSFSIRLPEVCRSISRVGYVRVAAINEPVDAAMPLVSQVTFVRVALTGLEALRRRVVLNDKVVPVENPDVSVRPDLGHDRCRPFVVAGRQIQRAGRAIPGSVALQYKGPDQLAGWTADERRAVPPLLRVIPCRIQSVPAACRVAAVLIDLPHLVADRLELIRVGDRVQHFRSPTPNSFVVPVRDRHEAARIVIRRRAENETFFTEPKTPGVVVRRAEELEVGDTRHTIALTTHSSSLKPESEEAHAKRLLRLAVDHWR